jgi:hypothetical protein
MAKPTLKGFELLFFPALGGAFRGHALHEGGQLDARAAHPVEIREHVVEIEAARILDDDVEKIGDGGGRRLDLLPQVGGQGAIEALVRDLGRQLGFSFSFERCPSGASHPNSG